MSRSQRASAFKEKDMKVDELVSIEEHSIKEMKVDKLARIVMG